MEIPSGNEDFMKHLQEDLKNNTFKPVYLLYGAEQYLLRQYKFKLKNAIVAGDDTMNFSCFEGKGIAPETVIDLAETMPFFAERRLILIENSGWFKKTPDKIADYLAELPDFTCFLFVEQEVDKRNRLFKLIQKKGRATELPRQSESTLAKWVLGILKREGKSISSSALELFFSKTGLEMDLIYSELEKLLCYTMDRETITSEDILTLTSARTPDQIFQMMDAISAKQTQKAITLYYDLLARREPPLRILSLLVRQFHILLKVKMLFEDGLSGQALVSKAGYPAFVVRKAMSQITRFSTKELLKLLNQCAAAEQDIKTGRLADKIAVELLLIKSTTEQ